MLRVLIDQYPAVLSHGELCDLAGYSPAAPTVGVILSKLRKLGLVEKGARRAAECPYCSRLFGTQQELEAHIARFGRPLTTGLPARWMAEWIASRVAITEVRALLDELVAAITEHEEWKDCDRCAAAIAAVRENHS